MKKISVVAILSLCILACQSEKNLKVNGSVKGLKKGKLYLQSYKDTAFVNLDSVVFNGNSAFNLGANIDYPQMLALKLNDGSKDEDYKRVYFFGDPNESYTIKSELRSFGSDPSIESNSKNQQKLKEFNKMLSQFNDQRLDLIALNMQSQQDSINYEIEKDSIENKYDNLIKRKYLYTVNFAINNKDLEIAPYVVLAEIYNANLTYLDTVYKSLTPNIKSSFYGKELRNLIEELKKAN